LARNTKNKKKKKSKAGDISKKHFFNHFKTLFAENSAFFNNEVEDEVSQKSLDEYVIEQFDKEFSIDEVDSAISSLKRGKSGDVDMMVSEIFIECIFTSLSL
jgi:hypothetical protein